MYAYILFDKQTLPPNNKCKMRRIFFCSEAYSCHVFNLAVVYQRLSTSNSLFLFSLHRCMIYVIP